MRTLGEKRIEKKFVIGIKALGGIALKIHSPWFTGLPDRLVVLPNIPMSFVELKGEKGLLSARQKIVIPYLQKLGVKVTVIGCEEELDFYLSKLKNAISSPSISKSLNNPYNR